MTPSPAQRIEGVRPNDMVRMDLKELRLAPHT
jgi:hypothetical protein